MKDNYVSDTSIVRLGGDDTTILPEKGEVVVFWSFLRARLWVLLHKMLVEFLKNWYIPSSVVPKCLSEARDLYMGSEEPRRGAKCWLFLLNLQASLSDRSNSKGATSQQLRLLQLCILERRSVSCPSIPKQVVDAWTREWFYVKNDLEKTEDNRDIIQRPIKPHFSIKRPACVIDDEAQAALMDFNIVCSWHKGSCAGASGIQHVATFY